MTVESLSRRLVGRLAAVMLVLSGGTAMATALVPSVGNRHPAGLLAVAGAAVALGTASWIAPWGRWPRRASLWLVPVIFTLIALGPLLGNSNPFTYGVYFAGVFAWMGVAHPRGTSLRFALPALAAFVLPFIGRAQGPAVALSGLQVIPACVVLGEVLAWVAGRLRMAETVNAARLAQAHELLTATERLAAAVEPGPAAELVARLALRLIGGHGALVLLADVDSLRPVAEVGWPGGGELRPRPDGIPSLARVMSSGEPAEVDASEPDGALAGGWASTLLVPLQGTSGTAGVVAIGFRAERAALDEFRRELLGTFATQAALAFERLRVTRALIDASLHDGLTSVSNRRAGDEALRSLRPGDAVALLDVDDLKRVNDRTGHAAGDEALRAFAAFLRDHLRDTDIVARYGGDEFLVVLRGAGGGATTTLRRLRDQWHRTPHATTFSAGVAVHDGAGEAEGFQTLVRADRALYRAKERGRDRVCSDEPEGARTADGRSIHATSSGVGS